MAPQAVVKTAATSEDSWSGVMAPGSSFSISTSVPSLPSHRHPQPWYVSAWHWEKSSPLQLLSEQDIVVLGQHVQPLMAPVAEHCDCPFYRNDISAN